MSLPAKLGLALLLASLLLQLAGVPVFAGDPIGGGPGPIGG